MPRKFSVIFSRTSAKFENSLQGSTVRWEYYSRNMITIRHLLVSLRSKNYSLNWSIPISCSKQMFKESRHQPKLASGLIIKILSSERKSYLWPSSPKKVWALTGLKKGELTTLGPHFLIWASGKYKQRNTKLKPPYRVAVLLYQSIVFRHLCSRCLNVFQFLKLPSEWDEHILNFSFFHMSRSTIIVSLCIKWRCLSFGKRGNNPVLVLLPSL